MKDLGGEGWQMVKMKGLGGEGGQMVTIFPSCFFVDYRRHRWLGGKVEEPRC